ncbi:MAG: ThiF family adenylyltransferase, partial [Pseudomonadota bacterium]
AAQDRLAARNPECQVHTHAEALTDDGLVELCERVDLVLDGTDHFTSRESINRACLKTGTPLVWGAAIRWEGQVTVFDSRREDSPCYRCLQPAVGDTVDRCAESGVVGPVVGTIGCLMATEAIKLVVAPERAAVGRLTHYDAWGSGFSQFQLPRLASCPACGAPAA